MFKLVLLVCCYISGTLCAVQITSVPLPRSANFAQNPFWDSQSQALYFPDILGENLFRYSHGDDKIVSVRISNSSSLSLPGIFMPVSGSNSTYVTSTNEAVIKFEWDGNAPVVSESETLHILAPNQYVNSGWALSDGQLYFGSYDNQYCNSSASNPVYKFLGNGGLNAASNRHTGFAGLVMVGDQLYGVEPCTKTLWAVQQNTSLQLSNPTKVMSLDVGDGGFPVGLAADTAGHLYASSYQAGLIYKIDPVKKEIIDKIVLPIQNPTSVTFGGPNYDILYVTSTTSNIDFNTLVRSDPAAAPAGNLFKITGLGVTGVPSNRPLF